MSWDQVIDALCTSRERNNVLVRAIESALDNGEFHGFPPSEQQWNALAARHYYIEQAEREIQQEART
jgi:hypothetical protein